MCELLPGKRRGHIMFFLSIFERYLFFFLTYGWAHTSYMLKMQATANEDGTGILQAELNTQREGVIITPLLAPYFANRKRETLQDKFQDSFTTKLVL